MEFELRQLSKQHGVEEYEMLQEIEKSEYGFTNEVQGMSYDEFKGWLTQQDEYSRSCNLPENFVPQTTYFLYASGKPVGLARIRHYASEFLENQGVGDFGYGIARPYRGQGYGTVLFGKVLEKCKELGYYKTQSFVNIDNVASNRIFDNYGAVLIGTFRGSKNIYEILL